MNARYIFIIAIIATFVLGWIPFVGWALLYPFELFGTFIHETWHALAAVLTGGKVTGMHVNWDTSGVTWTSGGSRFITASAGYLGSTVSGGILLLAARRQAWAQPTLILTGALTLLATVFFAGYGNPWILLLAVGMGSSLFAAGSGKASSSGRMLTWSGGAILLAMVVYLGLTGGLLTWAVGLFIGLGMLAVGGFASPQIAQGSLIFLGVQCSLDALSGVRTLLSIASTKTHSDAATLASLTGIPAVVWALVWLGLSVLILLGAFVLFWRDEKGVRSSGNGHNYLSG